MNDDPTRGSEGGEDDEDRLSDPGADLHLFETEWAAAWEDVHSEPAESLPVLDEIIGRMLDAAGYRASEPVTREGDEREVLDRYLAVHDAIVDGEIDESPGDVADAINALTEVYEALHSQLYGAGDAFGDDDE
ncbi:MAG TPA: hypothetical protein VGF46_03290 [Gaiellales bacterium]|jgi:hypothetical protein